MMRRRDDDHHCYIVHRQRLPSMRRAPLLIIAPLLAVQFYLARQIANNYHRRHISKVEDIINQPTNNHYRVEDTKSSSFLRNIFGHGEESSESNYNQKPRVVTIVDDDGEIFTTPYKLIKTKMNSIPHDAPIINSTSWYEPNAAKYLEKIYNLTDCEPMHEWQLQSYPNCNSFHELDLTALKYITSGLRRSAFEMREVVNGHEAQFVYKSIMYNNGKSFNEKRVEAQRVDALVLEKTHSSKFIPNIHGYCSIGILMDFTPGGSLYDYVKGARLAGGSTLPPIDRLRIAIHIAAGVADLHSIDGSSIPSFYHDDLDWHQYLYVDGIFMLNDFNYAKPIYVKKKKNTEVCLLTKGHLGIWKNRALDEFLAKTKHKSFTPFRPETIDVWMMGNQIYTVMTDLYPYEKPLNLNRTQALKKVINGERTELPEHIMNSHDPSYRAMIKALDMCWTYRWDKRPSARYITDYLMETLRKITGEEQPDLRVVLPKRDPDQKNTESDYELYNDGAND